MLMVAAAPALLAAEAPSARDALLACSGVREGVARLDCYDQAAAAQRAAGNAPAPRAQAAPAAPPTAAVPGPAVPAPTAPVPAAAAVPSSTFGEEQLRREARSATAEQQELHARIASTRKGGSGTYLVTLDNGQVWRHEEGSMAEYLREGEAVTIRPGTLGSYRLSLDSGKAKNWVRVTRVR